MLDKILSKKELSSIDKRLAEDILNKVLLSYKEIPSPRSKRYKEIIKKVRKELRKRVGLFNKGFSIDKSLVENLKSHQSTKERLNYISKIKKEISLKINFKSVLDLGCGLNPLFFINDNLDYIACDIDKAVCDIVNHFYKKEICFVCNLEKEVPLKKVDVAFLFKVLDSFSRKRAEEILKSINAHLIVVSFSIVTVSGKVMKYYNRRWLEMICNRLNFKYEKKIIGNEIFYFIAK